MGGVHKASKSRDANGEMLDNMREVDDELEDSPYELKNTEDAVPKIDVKSFEIGSFQQNRAGTAL